MPFRRPLRHLRDLVVGRTPLHEVVHDEPRMTERPHVGADRAVLLDHARSRFERALGWRRMQDSSISEEDPMAFVPYLFFRSNCRAAFQQYQQIFGGDLRLVTSDDMPPDERPPGARGDLIMHAALQHGDQMLMGSDDPTADHDAPVLGMMVNYSADDAAQAKRVFEQLAEGGEIRLDIAPTSFSPMFGMCVDRFGTPWMVGATIG